MILEESEVEYFTLSSEYEFRKSIEIFKCCSHSVGFAFQTVDCLLGTLAVTEIQSKRERTFAFPLNFNNLISSNLSAAQLV